MKATFPQSETSLGSSLEMREAANQLKRSDSAEIRDIEERNEYVERAQSRRDTIKGAVASTVLLGGPGDALMATQLPGAALTGSATIILLVVGPLLAAMIGACVGESVADVLRSYDVRTMTTDLMYACEFLMFAQISDDDDSWGLTGSQALP